MTTRRCTSPSSSTRVGDDDARGIAVVEKDADVQRLVVVDHPDFGRLRGRLSLLRVGLEEAVVDRRVLPGEIVQHAVDHGRRLDAYGGGRQALGGGW